MPPLWQAVRTYNGRTFQLVALMTLIKVVYLSNFLYMVMSTNLSWQYVNSM